MSDIILFILGTALVNNIITGHMAGVDPALAFSRRPSVANGLCLILLLLLPLATLCTYILQHGVLVPLDIVYLQLPLFVTLVIFLAGLLRLVLPLIHRRAGELAGIFLPIAAINTTVLGTVLLNLRQSANLWQALGHGFVTAFGFALVLLMLTSIREKLEYADVPPPFRGLPIMLVTLGLIGLAFTGFHG